MNYDYDGPHDACEVKAPHNHLFVGAKEPGYLESATSAIADQLATFYLALRARNISVEEATHLTIAWLAHTVATNP